MRLSLFWPRNGAAFIVYFFFSCQHCWSLPEYSNPTYKQVNTCKLALSSFPDSDDLYFELSKKAEPNHNGISIRMHSSILVKMKRDTYQSLPEFKKAGYKALDLREWDKLDLAFYKKYEQKFIVTLLYQAGIGALLDDKGLLLVKWKSILDTFKRRKVIDLLENHADLEAWASYLTPLAPDPGKVTINDWAPFPGRTFTFSGTVDQFIRENLFVSENAEGSTNPNWVLIGRVKGEESRSELHKDFPESDTFMETFWPTFDTGLSAQLVEQSGIRIRRNVVDRNPMEIEAFVFTNGRWMPILYKFDEARHEWIRRFVTNRGEPIWSACIKCHGFGADFGPAIKIKNYIPANWQYAVPNSKYQNRPRDIRLQHKHKDPLVPTFLGFKGKGLKQK